MYRSPQVIAASVDSKFTHLAFINTPRSKGDSNLIFTLTDIELIWGILCLFIALIIAIIIPNPNDYRHDFLPNLITQRP